MVERINIWDQLTYAGIERLDVGDMLRFEKDGSITELRVERKNIDHKELIVRPIQTMTVDEAEATVKVVSD